MSSAIFGFLSEDIWLSLIIQSFAYGDDVSWVIMTFAKLAVHSLIRDNIDHLTVSDKRLHDVNGVRVSHRDRFPRAKLDLSRRNIDN